MPARSTTRPAPTKLTHVVLNSADIENQTKFFLDVLGFSGATRPR